MRTLKFRVWDDADKRFYSCRSIAIGYMEDETANFRKENRYKFMQFTGCKDKNGIEIYEGDIIKHTWNKTMGFSENKEVIWGSYGDGEYVDNIECFMIGTYSLSDVCFSNIDGIEVIGNKFK